MSSGSIKDSVTAIFLPDSSETLRSLTESGDSLDPALYFVSDSSSRKKIQGGSSVSWDVPLQFGNEGDAAAAQGVKAVLRGSLTASFGAFFVVQLFMALSLKLVWGLILFLQLDVEN